LGRVSPATRLDHRVRLLRKQFSVIKRTGVFRLILREQQLYHCLGLYYLLEILPGFLLLTSTKIVKRVSRRFKEWKWPRAHGL